MEQQRGKDVFALYKKYTITFEGGGKCQII